MEIKMRELSIFAICFLMLLTGCENTAYEDQSSDNTASAIPPILRNIPLVELAAHVTFNDDETTTKIYSGADYPDGNWTIQADIALGQEHNIFIQWRIDDLVLLEQTGSFLAEITDPPIKPELSDISEGARRFDIDCDDISNLEESIEGSNPSIAEDPLQDGCNLEPEVPNDPNTALETFPRFDSSGLSERVTKFSQTMRIQNLNTDLELATGVSLYFRGEDDNRAKIELYYHPVRGKSVRMRDLSAVKVIPRETIGACDGTEHCSIPYDWQLQHWYELKERTLIATAEVEPGRIHIEPVLGQGYNRQEAYVTCTRGLAPTTIHFRAGVANDSFTLPAPKSLRKSDCVKWGGGSSTDVLFENGQAVYSRVI